MGDSFIEIVEKNENLNLLYISAKISKFNGEALFYNNQMARKNSYGLLDLLDMRSELGTLYKPKH